MRSICYLITAAQVASGVGVEEEEEEASRERLEALASLLSEACLAVTDTVCQARFCSKLDILVPTARLDILVRNARYFSTSIPLLRYVVSPHSAPPLALPPPLLPPPSLSASFGQTSLAHLSPPPTASYRACSLRGSAYLLLSWCL